MPLWIQTPLWMPIRVLISLFSSVWKGLNSKLVSNVWNAFCKSNSTFKSRRVKQTSQHNKSRRTTFYGVDMETMQPKEKVFILYKHLNSVNIFWTYMEITTFNQMLTFKQETGWYMTLFKNASTPPNFKALILPHLWTEIGLPKCQSFHWHTSVKVKNSFISL